MQQQHSIGRAYQQHMPPPVALAPAPHAAAAASARGALPVAALLTVPGSAPGALQQLLHAPPPQALPGPGRAGGAGGKTKGAVAAEMIAARDSSIAQLKEVVEVGSEGGSTSDPCAFSCCCCCCGFAFNPPAAAH